MQCTIAADEPLLLLDVAPATPFLPFDPDLGECVCVRLIAPNALQPLPDFDTGDESIAVVVIASRVDPGDQGYLRPGTVLRLRWSHPVIELDLVERVAFRERARAGSPTFARHADVPPSAPSPQRRSACRAISATGAEATPPPTRL